MWKWQEEIWLMKSSSSVCIQGDVQKRFAWQRDVIQLIIEHFQSHSVLVLLLQTVTDKKDYQSCSSLLPIIFSFFSGETLPYPRFLFLLCVFSHIFIFIYLNSFHKNISLKTGSSFATPFFFKVRVMSNQSVRFGSPSAVPKQYCIFLNLPIDWYKRSF